MSKSTKLTVKQFAETNNIKTPEASQFLKVLAGSGAIDIAGSKKTGDRGRAATVYEVNPDILTNLKLKCPTEGVEGDIIPA